MAQPHASTRLPLLCLTAVALPLLAAPSPAGDWTMWRGTPGRNAASPEKHLPAAVTPGREHPTSPDQPPADSGRRQRDRKHPDRTGRTPPVERFVEEILTAQPPGKAHPPPPRPKAVQPKWTALLGPMAYTECVVAGGKVFVGTAAPTPYRPGEAAAGGAMLCLDEATGKLLWQLSLPRCATDRGKLFNFDHLRAGICSTPIVDGTRLYVVSNRAEILCLDTRGQADGNDGPFTDEARLCFGDKDPRGLADDDGDIVWRYDMLAGAEIDCWPQDAVSSSPLLRGDYLYVCPGNGVDRSHKNIPRPGCPSMVALDKRTGKVLAFDDARIGPRIFHGEWSSPSLGRVNGRDLIFHGGGDGVCYAFAADPAPPAGGAKTGTLRTVWRFDVNAAAGRQGKYKTPNGPSEIIATPVFADGRVYVAVGQDPNHGPGSGSLACIDAAKTGDITRTGLVWVKSDIGRSLSACVVADGLVYVADLAGRLYCLDADTGRACWTLQTRHPVWSSPLVADGKVYLGTQRGELWIVVAGRQLKVLSRNRLPGGISCSPIAANGTLFVAAKGFCWAFACPRP